MLRPTQTLDPFVSAEAEHLRNKEHKQKGLFGLLYTALCRKKAKLRNKKLYLLAVARMPLKNICFSIQYNLLYALIFLALCSFCLLINLFSAVTLFFAHSLVTKYCNLLQIS